MRKAGERVADKKRKQFEVIMSELDNGGPCPALVDKTGDTSDSDRVTVCLAHSGVKTALRFMADDQISIWDAIRYMDRRLWTILIGICGVLGMSLLNLILWGVFMKTISKLTQGG